MARRYAIPRFASSQGAARVADGLGMLVEQAAEAFFSSGAACAQTAPVIARLRERRASPKSRT
jgi:shikimate dehydrogenase